MASETCLILPVPEAEPVVARWRSRFDPSAGEGIPAHVTVLAPFIPYGRIGRDDLSALSVLFARTGAIAFQLAAVQRFAGVVYLEPRPAQRLIELTRHVWERWPDYPPYGGEHETVVPHLTVAVGSVRDEEALVRDLESRLPVAAKATEAWLLRREANRWEQTDRFPLTSG